MIPLPILAVGLPGAGNGGPWLIHWNLLFTRLIREYSVLPCYGTGCNIYEVRNRCIPQWDQIPANRPVHYMLWIDSDNLPTWDDFARLRAGLIRHAELDGIGAWYWTQDAMGQKEPEISAGWWSDSEHPVITMQDVEQAGDNLIPVDYLGMGFFLMRALSLRKLGPRPCVPALIETPQGIGFLGDDISFCYQAKQAGLRFAIDPKVKVPHLKSKPIEPEAISRIKVAGPEVVAQGDTTPAQILASRELGNLEEVPR